MTACPSSWTPRRRRSGWNPATEDPDRLSSLLRPYPSEEMEAYPVSTIVNSSRDDRAEMIKPLEVAESGGPLTAGQHINC